MHDRTTEKISLVNKGLERFDSKTSSEYTVGAYSITVLIGRYYSPRAYFMFKENVFVSWAFDKDKKLIKVIVDKFVAK